MKILLGTPEFPPYDIGGGSQVYKNLVNQFRKLGHQVVVIYGYYPARSWNRGIKRYNEKGVTFYQIPELPYPKFLPTLKLRMPPTLENVKKMREILVKESPDVVFLHGYSFLFIDILASQLSKLGKSYNLTIHGWPIQQKGSNFFVKTVWKIYETFLLYSILKKSKKIICVSNFLKNQIPKQYRNKAFVIPNGINFNDLEQTKSKINVRKKYNLDSSDLLILSLGRISYIKGFQEVIKKIPGLLNSGYKVKYLIAGEDEGFKKNLTALISDLNLNRQVSFIGQLNDEQKNDYLVQSDILAIPSLWEGFGLVCLEGIYYNKTVLTTNLAAPKEILAKYPKKIDIYKDDIIKKHLEIKKMRTKFDWEKYNWKTIAREYLKLAK